MKNTKVISKVGVPQAKTLYVGTNEQVAKLAPVSGLEPPIYLTDVYPGFFCKQLAKDGRWGIISVDVNALYQEMLAPSPEYLNKHKKNKVTAKDLARLRTRTTWQKSIDNCGVCVYTSRIPPNAIQKVMIYSPVGRDTNTAINQLVSELPEPHSITPSEHKALRQKSLGILRWFAGEAVRCDDIFNGQTNLKLINEIDDKLINRAALDVYYIRQEEKERKRVHK